jgi:hypothetical protein
VDHPLFEVLAVAFSMVCLGEMELAWMDTNASTAEREYAPLFASYRRRVIELAQAQLGAWDVDAFMQEQLGELLSAAGTVSEFGRDAQVIAASTIEHILRGCVAVQGGSNLEEPTIRAGSGDSNPARVAQGNWSGASSLQLLSKFIQDNGQVHLDNWVAAVTVMSTTPNNANRAERVFESDLRDVLVAGFEGRPVAWHLYAQPESAQPQHDVNASPPNALPATSATMSPADSHDAGSQQTDPVEEVYNVCRRRRPFCSPALDSVFEALADDLAELERWQDQWCLDESASEEERLAFRATLIREWSCDCHTEAILPPTQLAIKVRTLLERITLSIRCLRPVWLVRTLVAVAWGVCQCGLSSRARGWQELFYVASLVLQVRMWIASYMHTDVQETVDTAVDYLSLLFDWTQGRKKQTLSGLRVVGSVVSPTPGAGSPDVGMFRDLTVTAAMNAVARSSRSLAWNDQDEKLNLSDGSRTHRATGRDVMDVHEQIASLNFASRSGGGGDVVTPPSLLESSLAPARVSCILEVVLAQVVDHRTKARPDQLGNHSRTSSCNEWPSEFGLEPEPTLGAAGGSHDVEQADGDNQVGSGDETTDTIAQAIDVAKGRVVGLGEPRWRYVFGLLESAREGAEWWLDGLSDEG